MDIASTSRSRFRHSEDELDRLTQRDTSDYDDDDDDDDRISDAENSSLGLGTMQSLSISSDGNKTMKPSAMSLTRTSSTSSSTSSKMPQKKIRVWEVFKWLLDIERSTKNCLGSMTEMNSTTILNEMDFLLRFVIKLV